jgi:predicted GIY-YIG superfamily endonuclease
VLPDNPGSVPPVQPRGFFVVRARDLAEAQRIAAACPHLRYGGRIVLRRTASRGGCSLVLSLSKDEPAEMQFWVYILTCADGSYYVSHSDDLELRIAAHQDGTFGGYTQTRRPVALSFAEAFDSRDDAFGVSVRSRAGRGPRKKR